MTSLAWKNIFQRALLLSETRRDRAPFFFYLTWALHEDVYAIELVISGLYLSLTTKHRKI